MVYNFGKRAKVINTFQCYTYKSWERCEIERNKTEFFGEKYPTAFKLVRGAYILEEREIEKKENRILVFETKQQTDENYDKIASTGLSFLNNQGQLIIASHNNDSAYHVMTQIEYCQDEQRKEFLQNRVFFATLYGLNDFLAYQCLYSNYHTIKSLSFGKDDVTIPFLLRRGIECQEVMKRSGLELTELRKEIFRRMTFRK